MEGSIDSWALTAGSRGLCIYHWTPGLLVRSIFVMRMFNGVIGFFSFAFYFYCFDCYTL